MIIVTLPKHQLPEKQIHQNYTLVKIGEITNQQNKLSETVVKGLKVFSE